LIGGLLLPLLLWVVVRPPLWLIVHLIFFLWLIVHLIFLSRESQELTRTFSIGRHWRLFDMTTTWVKRILGLPIIKPIVIPLLLKLTERSCLLSALIGRLPLAIVRPLETKKRMANIYSVRARLLWRLAKAIQLLLRLALVLRLRLEPIIVLGLPSEARRLLVGVRFLLVLVKTTHFLRRLLGSIALPLWLVARVIHVVPAVVQGLLWLKLLAILGNVALLLLLAICVPRATNVSVVVVPIVAPLLLLL